MQRPVVARMRIEIEWPDGRRDAIAGTEWSTVAQAIETVALDNGPDAVFDWCAEGGPDRPPVDDVWVHDVSTLIVSVFDAEVEAAGAAAWEARLGLLS